MSSFGSTLEKLYRIVEERKEKLPEGSYTAELFRKGEDRILKKLGEEAVEVILALKSKNKEHAVYETADLIYHLTVALVNAGITWQEIGKELVKRMK